MDDPRFGPVRFLQGEDRGRYPYCNSLYIEGPGILIDPGSNRERLLRLRTEEEVRMVWLSHWHEDHFAHLDLFDDLPLWVSEPDTPPLGDLDLLMHWYGFNEEEKGVWGPRLLHQFHFRPRKPARFLVGGEVVRLGGLSIVVVGVPGHTPGHLAFFFRDASVLFTGDYDLTSFGPWYGDRFSDIDQVYASIERLRGISASVVLAGHEAGVFQAPTDEVWARYASVIGKREEKLLELLNEPKTLEEIAAACIVYGKPREPKAFFGFGERAQMAKHLEHLQKRRLVFLEDGRYRSAKEVWSSG